MGAEDNPSATVSGMRIGLLDSLRRLRVAKRGMVIQIVLWNLGCLTLGVVMWIGMAAELDAERRGIEHRTAQDATVLANAYAQYLARLIEQVDQTTLLVKYEWERSGRALKLEELVGKGIFASSQYARVSIGDRDGVPLTATTPTLSLASMRDRDYFRFHVQHRSTELRIGKPIVGRASGKVVIPFTRRLETSDGSFDGVALASVEPAFFASFYEGSSLGRQGMLAVVGVDGTVRMAGIGGASGSQSNPVLERITLLDPAGSGTLRAGDAFDDRQARYVAWRAVRGYPLLAVVGIAVEERLAAHRQTRTAYRNGALAGSALLLLAALGGTLFGARVSLRRQQKAEVHDVYRVATEIGDDGFFMLRPLRDAGDRVVDFMVADCNERGAGFSGLAAAGMNGKRISDLYQDPYRQVVINSFRNAMDRGDFEDELEIPPESPIRVAWIRRKFVRSGTGLALTIRDISKDKAQEQALWRMANADVLTALPNRNWLMTFLASTLERVAADGGTLAVLFIDLDDFKDVNDALGHSAGDELLRLAAERLKAWLRPTDHVVRLGGDEFTVILEPLENTRYASDVAERICTLFNQPFELAGGNNAIGASVGISLFPQDGDTVELLLKYSDIAMYHAKGAGRGRYCFYAPSMSQALKARLELERALAHAIEVDQFVMHYQPRVCTFTGELLSLEALVRWNHPVRGLVPPLEFIPLAEATGLIIKLGELVVAKVCRQVCHWKSSSVEPVPVSINVSPRQFNQGNIADIFATALASNHLAASLIEIEITESSMMGEAELIARQLAALRVLGVKLLVDDFGTGYSSLSTLRDLDMDVLKVDRAFTSELGENADGQAFYRAIMSMAHALGMRVVAEGVETAIQLRALQMLGCYEIQGYLVSRPVPADEIPALMNRRFLLPPELTAPLPPRTP